MVKKAVLELLTCPLVSVGVGGCTGWAGSVGCAGRGWVSRVGGVGRVGHGRTALPQQKKTVLF